MTTTPMLILDTFTVRGRGLVITGYPAAPDGRRWTVAEVEMFNGRWRPEGGAGVLLARGGSEPLPCKGETVMVECHGLSRDGTPPRETA